MGLRLDDKILAPRRGDAAIALAYLDRPDAKDAAYIDALWRWCGVAGVDFAIAFAWFLVETADATSVRWNRDLNPGGIGIPADSTVQPFVIPDSVVAARLHVQCLYSIVTRVIHPDIPLWPEALTWMHRVWLPKVNDPAFPRVERLTDLDIRYDASDGEPHATWAWGHQEGQPAPAAIDKARRVWPALPDQGQETESMALPVPFFERRIAPQGIPNRTGLVMASPSWVTIHEVGNRSVGADEEMHVRFVHNGGGGVSFHFIVGPTKACQIIELDEACWHASDGFNGTGNRDSIAIETVQIGDFDKTLWHLAWLCAELMVNPGRFVWRRGVPNPYAITDQVFTQHNHWAPDKKNCPQQIRERGLWPVLMQRIDQYIAAAKPSPAPTPIPPPKPKPPSELPNGMTWQLVARLYNPLGIKDPDTGRKITFSRNSKTAMAWFTHAKASIPAGKIWTAGQWGGLLEVIRRGDGGRVYQFVDYLHQVGPPKEQEAA